VNSAPKTYLVPEKDRVPPPPPGFWKWLIPIFKTPNAVLMEKCGLDAYFFLRFLRMLLKIFVPSAILILPILLPINSAYHSNGSSTSNTSVQGLDRLGWQNFDPDHTSRLWAHCVLAVLLIIWFCYVVHDELRGYIRVRQAYLTSPQHRLRASATTVLVTSIPHKWLTYEALDGLYDVFPGGIRNIWINRNFDELADKVKLRDKLASKLESAETNLIRNAKQKATEKKAKEEKKAGIKRTKAEKKQLQKDADQAGNQMALQPGLSSGNPHQAHTLEEELGEVYEESNQSSVVGDNEEKFPLSNIPVLGKGVEAIGHGLRGVGQGFSKFGKSLVKDVTGARKGREEQRDEDPLTYDGGSETREGASRDSGDTTVYREQTLPERLSSEPDNLQVPTTGKSVPDTGIRNISEQKGQTRSNQGPPEVRIESPKSDSHPETPAGNVGRSKSQRNHPDQKAVEWTRNGFLQQPAEKRGWKIWRDSHGINLPSPQPHFLGDSQFPFDKAAGAGADAEEKKGSADKTNNAISSSRLVSLFSFWQWGKDELAKEEYPPAYNGEYANDQGFETEPEWKKHLKPGDRDTMRLPLFGLTWMPFMPSWTFIGKKVDTIYYCRKEVARLNLEIEKDQQEPEKFPLMNSAFIQFNHQVAAHMACQSVGHHIPHRMAPRHVEIAPDDVIWDNLSIKWWERYARMGVAFVVVVAMVILWAIPVSLTSSVSKLTTLAQYNGFHWVLNLPKWLASAIQGVLPWLLLTILLILVPIIMRFMAALQGLPTNMSVELSVQNYYFAFIFVQIFLVNTIAQSVITVVNQIAKNPADVLTILAKNIPQSANYFFSYMLLQALSTSATNLAQLASVALWFLWRPIVDSTARDKFKRQMIISSINWGTFFPTFTNLACIGLVFSVIAPFIMIFNIITFSLFWFVFRYQSLYVNKKAKNDTGGLLFPRAVNQLFLGIYIMELALIGLFFIVRDGSGKASCFPQGIVMAVVLIFTALYHILINMAFSPLYRYMPITLEDDAVRRDEEYELARSKRWQLADAEVGDDEKGLPRSQDPEDIEEQLERREREEEEEDRLGEEIELQEIEDRRRSRHNSGKQQASATENPEQIHGISRFTSGAARLTAGATNRIGTGISNTGRGVKSWADRSRNRRTSSSGNPMPDSDRPHGPSRVSSANDSPHPRVHRLRTHSKGFHLGATIGLDKLEAAGGPTSAGIAASSTAVGDALFGHVADELEDLTAEERDRLVQRAFQHEAVRARRPAIWIPRDDLGISDDEVRRTQAFSEHYIWITNEGTGLDRKARVLIREAPPDFSEVDLIEL
jgi:calcium permeable stress-gated cation channel